MIIEIFVLIFLILVNAFFAASEIALISLNDNKIHLMAASGNKKARLISSLIGEPSRFLATIQIGITLAGFLASAFASESFADPIVKAIVATGAPVSESVVKTVSMLVITLILAYFTLVLGELVPKRLAMKKAESIAMAVASPLHILSKATAPFVKLLTVSSNLVVRLFGVDPNAEDEQVTEEEIRMMVDVGGERGTIHEEEKEMINNIFEFNNKVVSSIMTHRTEISALPDDADLDEVTAYIHSKKYSRIPVYHENIDDIIGVLQAKHLIQYLSGEHDRTKFNLSDMIKHPFTVPESKRIDELLREMNQKKMHMAVVIDEYGGTAGIVTIEDLIEEIVGNIFDEDDVDETDIEKIDEATYRFKGSASLLDVQKVLSVGLPTDEYDTLNGFVISQLGRIPEVGERLSIEFSGHRMSVEMVEGKRISSIIITKL
ncbi:MAG: hemolysin family protein [Bacillota bacterium]|nr:hemolysin family protein [Bacillota bacterium]